MFDSRVLEIKRIKRGGMREDYVPCTYLDEEYTKRTMLNFSKMKK
jgi:hypothetical protein